VERKVTAMLMGEFEHTIDAKGRLFIPAKMREELGKPFYITKGFDGCLTVYPKEAWDRLTERMSQQDLPGKDARNVSRFLLGGAVEVETDKQGRVLLPANLRRHAHITENVTIVGVGSRAEIWDTERYNAYAEDASADVENAVERLSID
jgi:MraZ protein